MEWSETQLWSGTHEYEAWREGGREGGRERERETYFGESIHIRASSHQELGQLQVPMGAGTHERGPAILSAAVEVCPHREEEEGDPYVTLLGRLMEGSEPTLGGREGGREGGRKGWGVKSVNVTGKREDRGRWRSSEIHVKVCRCVQQCGVVRCEGWR